MNSAAPPVAPGAGDDLLGSSAAGGRVIVGSFWRVGASVGGTAMGVLTAALLLRHLGVAESGRYIAVIALVAIPVAVVDVALNITGSRELALHGARDRVLLANIVGQRLATVPVAVVLVVLFALAVGYPSRMVVGTLLAATGLMTVALADAVLLPLTAELRNVGLAMVDLLKQFVTLVGVAALVVVGAKLTPFFALQIAVGLAVVAAVPLLRGARAFVRPRFDRSQQRMLLASGLPMAIAMALSQIYFRLVVVLMSVVATARQTGYFAASFRAIESAIVLPVLVAGVALPLLAAAARDDRARFRYAVEGLSKGAVIAGVLVVLVAFRLATPVMALIGGHRYGPAGAVLRIQAGALVFIALDQIWGAALIALGRQRDLILTNALALAGVAAFAGVLVPAYGAQGGAVAGVLGELVLGSLIFWRLRRAAGKLTLSVGFLVRVAVAAAVACGAFFIPGLPDWAEAALAGILFLGVGQVVGMVPEEVHEALALRRSLGRH